MPSAHPPPHPCVPGADRVIAELTAEMNALLSRRAAIAAAVALEATDLDISNGGSGCEGDGDGSGEASRGVTAAAAVSLQRSPRLVEAAAAADAQVRCTMHDLSLYGQLVTAAAAIARCLGDLRTGSVLHRA